MFDKLRQTFIAELLTQLEAIVTQREGNFQSEFEDLELFLRRLPRDADGNVGHYMCGIEDGYLKIIRMPHSQETPHHSMAETLEFRDDKYMFGRYHDKKYVTTIYDKELRVIHE